MNMTTNPKLFGGNPITDNDPLAVQLDAVSRAALESITVDALAIADGADVTQGAIADAAATAGGTGTISAKLRRISTQLGAALGQTTSAASMPVVIASDQSLIPVGGSTAVVAVNPTVDTAIYAALDIIGGELTITGAMRISGGTGILQAITIIDDDNEKAAFDILLYNAALSGTKTDNGALGYNSADAAKFLGRVQVLSSDYLTYISGSQAIASIRGIGLPVASSGSANLFAIILATGTPTYTAATDLHLMFHFLRD
jgi:hypothetical protein